MSERIPYGEGQQPPGPRRAPETRPAPETRSVPDDAAADSAHPTPAEGTHPTPTGNDGRAPTGNGGPAPTGGGAPSKTMNEEDRAPWGLTIRVTFYLVGVHIFAAFLFLLFHLGAK